MTPREIYRKMLSRIREADVRLVAAVMEDHIGRENVVTIGQLTARTGMHERVIRSILSTLVIDYGIPIGALSGRAGRWIIATEEERQAVIADLQSRASETNKRLNSLRNAKLVQSAPVEVEPVIPTLFGDDMPEPKRTYQWEW